MNKQTLQKIWHRHIPKMLCALALPVVAAAAGKTVSIHAAAQPSGILDNLIVKAPDQKATDFKISATTVDSVTLTWTKASDAATYYISFWESGKPSTAVTKEDIGDVSEYKLTNLNQAKYMFQIQPANKLHTGIPLKGPITSIEGAPDSKAPSKITFNNIKNGYCSLYIEGVKDIYQSQVQLFDASDNLLGTYRGDFSGASIKDACIKDNGFYTVKVRGVYDQAGGYRSSGDWSEPYYFSTAVKPLKVSQKNGKAVLKWSQVQGAANYTVFISKSAASGFKKSVVVKSPSATIAKFGSNKLKSKKTYYFKVAASMSRNGDVYTAESVPVKIKMK